MVAQHALRRQKLRMILTLVAGFFVLSAYLSGSVFAATGINQTINFQGKVVNTYGTNVSDGNYNMIFELYDASAAGSQLWTETWNSGTSQVSLTDGVFRVALGTYSSMASLDFNQDNLWLKVTFNGEAMSPRIRFTSVPYAFEAKRVAGLTVTNNGGNTLNIAANKTFTVSNTITLAGPDGNTYTFGTPASGSSDTVPTLTSTSTLTNKTIGSTGLTFSGATTDVATAGSEAFTIVPGGTGAVQITSGVTSGTGTSSGLSVAASSLTSGTGLNVSSAATALTGFLANIELTSSNANNTGTLFRVGAAATNAVTTAMITNLGTGISFRVNDETGDADATPFIIDASGNVGVGTTNPSAPLSVGASSQFQVSSVGAVTAVGVNSGSGLLQGTGGITVTGTASINATGTSGTSIGNSTGTLALVGGASSTIDFSNFDVAATGNITVAGGVGLDTNAAGALNLGNATATSINIGNTAATTINIGAGGNLTRTFNIGTGTGADTINIGVGTTTADTINIGTGAVANTIALGSSSTTSLSLTDDNWNVSAAGAANFVSIGATTRGSGQFTTLDANGNVTIGDAAGDSVTVNSAAWTFANDTNVTLSGGTAGLNFDTNTLSIDASNDRIGIGTTAPGSTLELVGTFSQTGANTFSTGTGAISLNGSTTVAAGKNLILASGVGTFTQTFTGTTGPAFTLTASGAVATGNAAALDINVSNASTSVPAMMISNAGSSFALRVNDDGTTTDTTPFVVDASGNVGVGTTSVTAGKLQVVGTVRSADGSRTAVTYGFSSEGGDTGMYLVSDNNLAFANGATDTLFIRSDGNIGIGTTSPSTAKLVVNGTLHGSNGSRGAVTYGFSSEGGDTGMYLSSDNNLAFANGATDTLFIRSDGNIGIGTTSPSTAKLVVNGTLHGSNGSRGAVTYGFSSEGGDTGMYLSSDNNLAFATAATDRMFIDASGNVGIGTTSPGSNRLYVTGGPSRFDAAMSAASSFSAPVLGYNTTALGTTAGNYSGNMALFQGSVDGNYSGLHIYNIRTASSSNWWETKTRIAHTIQTDGYAQDNGYNNNEWIDFDFGGKILMGTSTNAPTFTMINGSVGIGTTTPAHALDIVSSSGQDGINISAGTYPEIVLKKAGTTKAYIGIAGNANGYATGTFADSLAVRAEGSYMHLITGAANIAMTVNGTNIGIGTTSPSQLLALSSAGSTTGTNIQLTNTSALAVGNLITQKYTFNAGTHGEYGMIETSTGSSGLGDFYWNTWNGSTYAERMRLTNAGNVGIGTTAPSAKLEISGDILQTSGINALGSQESMAPNAGFEINADATTTLADGWGSNNDLGSPTFSTTTTTPLQGDTSQQIVLPGGGSVTGRVYSICFPLTNSRNYFGGVKATNSSGTASVAVGLETYGSKSACTSRTPKTDVQIVSGSVAGLVDIGSASSVGIGSTARWGRAYVTSNQTTATTTKIDSVLIKPDHTSGGVDLAENFPVLVSENIQSGELVSAALDEDHAQYALRTQKPYDKNILGVVSTKPGIVLDDPGEYERKPIALTGRVPVKVNVENGKINIGDYLTSSSTPGIAMKQLKPGMSIGRALTSYDGTQSQATVIVFVQTGYINPGIQITYTGDLQLSNTIAKDTVYDGNLGDSESSVLSKQYELLDKSGQAVTNVIFAGQGLFGKIKTGLLDAQNAVVKGTLVAANTVTTTLQSTTVKTTSLIASSIKSDSVSVSEKIASPVIDTDNITVKETAKADKVETNVIKPQTNDLTIDLNITPTPSENGEAAGPLAKLLIKGREGRDVASIDAKGNASFSGTIAASQVQADSVVSSDISTDTLAVQSGRINSLEGAEASLSGKLVAKEVNAENIQKLASDVNSVQQLLASLQNQPVPNPSYYQNIPSDIDWTGNNITSTGNANLYNVSVTNVFTAGNIMIENNSILALASDLRLSSLSTITLFDNAVVIAKDGTITTQGTIIAKKGIKTNTIQAADPSKDVNVILGTAGSRIEETTKTRADNQKFAITNNLGVEVASVDASGSAHFNDIALNKYVDATSSATVIASAQNFAQNGIFAPAIETNMESAGVGVIPATEMEVIIYNKNISENSLIYLTPNQSIPNGQLSVVEKNTCKNSTDVACKPYFKVSSGTMSDHDLKFNWLIIN
jgi:hypothetical protein